MIIKNKILLLSGLFFVQQSIAQSGVTIKAIVDKNKILIGQPIHLTIETFYPGESAIRAVTVDSIAHFEFVEKPVIDTAKKNGGWNIKREYTITSFDSGHWYIPAFILSKDNHTDSIPIDVIFSDVDPDQPYHDIKDILEVKSFKKKKTWWWYVAGGAMIIGMLLLYLRQKKKMPSLPVYQTAISPYEEAMAQLNKLTYDRLDVKQYYSKLTAIFRLYIFRKKGILSLQKTTEDLIRQLHALSLNNEQFDKISQSLRLSDFVKFAKFLPSENEGKIMFDTIKNTIIAIEEPAVKRDTLTEI